ncbi:UNVERIFIED_ORG: nucleoid DNA-binding protein [Burkholderia sp. 1263]
MESSTLDEIVDALSSGRPIALPQNAGNFMLDSKDARAAFRFYASRRDLWPQQKQLSRKEVDDLLQALETPKPANSGHQGQAQEPAVAHHSNKSASLCWFTLALRR